MSLGIIQHFGPKIILGHSKTESLTILEYLDLLLPYSMKFSFLIVTKAAAFRLVDNVSMVATYFQYKMGTIGMVGMDRNTDVHVVSYSHD